MAENIIRILLLGKSGVGKSSFINYLFDEDVAKVADGLPCTQGLNKYSLKQWENCIIEIYDSKGLEVLDADNYRKDILNELKERNGGDISDWFHTIFYCISAKKKVEDYEFRLIEDMRDASRHHIHIIETNCDGIEKDRLSERENILKEKLGQQTKIYRIVSVNMKKRNGDIVSQSGKEDVLDNIFRMFWYDISDYISNDVSKTLRSGLLIIAGMMKKYIDDIIKDNAGFFKMCKFLYYAIKSDDGCTVAPQDDLSLIIDEIGKELEKKYESLCSSTAVLLQRDLNAANRLYSSYAQAMDQQSFIDAEDILDDCLDKIVYDKFEDFSDVFDIDDLSQYALNKLSILKFIKVFEELEEEMFDGDGIFEDESFKNIMIATGKVISLSGKLGIGLLKLKKELLRIVNDYYSEICSDIRSKDFKGMLYDKMISLVEE